MAFRVPRISVLSACMPTSSLHGALVRSHSERHALSQELDALKDKLSRYQNREAQTATAP